MGAWGAGAFENDDALDFAGGVTTVDDIAAAFITWEGEIIEADVASAIVAAAECVAAMLGRPSEDLPDGLATRLRAFGRPDATLLETARDNLSAVISSSELTELWAEADDPSAFNRAITGLIDRLNPEIPAAKPAGRARKPDFNPSPCVFCNKPMGEENFSSFDISLDLGGGHPVRLGKWAHLECLNARLHPAHIVQAWKTDPATLEDDVARLLQRDGDAENS